MGASAFRYYCLQSILHIITCILLYFQSVRTPVKTEFLKEVEAGHCRLIPNTAEELRSMINSCLYDPIKGSNQVKIKVDLSLYCECMVPTMTRKCGNWERIFQSENLKHIGEVREFYTKYWKRWAILEIKLYCQHARNMEICLSENRWEPCCGV